MTSGFWSADEYDRQAQEQYEAGDYDAALGILREGVALYPDAVELRISLGFTLLARESFVWARRAFAAALELEEDHEDGLAGIGEAYLKLGERARGLAAFERVLELGFARDADLMLSIGRALVREDLLEHAERYFRLAVEADEGAVAAADLAYVMQRRGRRAEARHWFRVALEEDPDNHDVRALLAHDLYEAGDRRAALAEYERIPAAAMWDSLTLWRVIELLRACRREADDGPAVRPYLERLDALFDASSPEDRLIEEVVSTASEDGSAGPGRTGQFDLFRPGAEGAPIPGEPAADWSGIVRVLCRMSSNPDRTVEQFMEDTADRVQAATGLAIPTDDAGAFLEASARAGVLRLDDWNHGRSP